MLKLLKTDDKRKVDYKDIYCRNFDCLLSEYFSNTENKDYIKKLTYYGVKAVNEISEQELDYEQLVKLFELTETVKTIIGLLTPKELTTIFPVDKEFDGNKYGMKDYFFTMKELEKIGMENMIAGQAEYLLWDYTNKDIGRFVVNSLSSLSSLIKYETGKGLMEKWTEDNGIVTYKLCKDEVTNKQFLYDPKNKTTIGVKKKVPRYLKLLK